MDAKILFSFVFAVVIGQAYYSDAAPQSPASSYPETFKTCLKEFKLEKDDPLTNYLKTGKFASDEETASLKCFFSCLTEKLSLSDASGKLNGEGLKTLAKENPTENELAVFASDEVQKACIPLPAKFPSGSACESVYSFTQCALETQAQLPQKQ